MKAIIKSFRAQQTSVRSIGPRTRSVLERSNRSVGSRVESPTLDAESLWNSTKHVYYACLFHPFVRDLAKGALPKGNFEKFLAEDVAYLTAFRAALFAVHRLVLASPMTPNRDLALIKSRFLVEAVETELVQVHATRQAATRPSWATESYVAFLKGIERDPDCSIVELLAGLIPCLRLYFELAMHFQRSGEVPANHPYAHWIRHYSSEQSREAVSSAEWLFDQFSASGIAHFDSDRCRRIFQQAMLNELAFFGVHHGPSSVVRRNKVCDALVLDFREIFEAPDLNGGGVPGRRYLDILRLALVSGAHVIVSWADPGGDWTPETTQRILRSHGLPLKSTKCVSDVSFSEEPAVHFVRDSQEDMRLFLAKRHVTIVLGHSRSLSSAMTESGLESLPLEGLEFGKNMRKEQPQTYQATTWTELHGLLSAFVWDAEEEERKAKETDEFIPRVLLISGSDSGGGAGMQADIKTCANVGVFSTNVLTAATVQNTVGVHGVHVLPGSVVKEQMRAVHGDIGTSCIKVGMLGSVETALAVGEELRSMEGNPPIVVDPVLFSSSGSSLAEEGIIDAMKQHIFPQATLITPNVSEASILLGNFRIDSLQSMQNAAIELHKLGPEYVLVKGGHLVRWDAKGKPVAVDLLFDGTHFTTFSRPYVLDSNNNHGTGCTLAAAIASHLARGEPMRVAVERAKDFVWRTIEQSSSINLGSGMQRPMNHFHSHPNMDWGRLNPSRRLPNPINLSLYAVSSPATTSAEKTDAEVLEIICSVVSGGASVIQIRDKVSEGGRLARLVSKICRICRPFGVKVIVNDRVDVCIAADACGVHVGQGDIPARLVRRMIGPDKILGVSCKTVEQAKKAQQDGADYLGCGAVFDTPTKDSRKIGAQGVRKIKSSVDIPIVAIGGLNASNIESTLMESGCDGVAVVRAIFDATDIRGATAALRDIVDASISYEK